jgi:hypothetical protein
MLDPCQLDRRPEPIFKAMTYQPDSIGTTRPSDSGVWHIFINGEKYRIDPHTQLAVTKPDRRTETISAEEIHNHLTEPFTICASIVASDGVKSIESMTFHDP